MLTHGEGLSIDLDIHGFHCPSTESTFTFTLGTCSLTHGSALSMRVGVVTSRHQDCAELAERLKLVAWGVVEEV